MAGNVWEWTRSLDKKYPYDPADGREDLKDKKGNRVLRGGAFNFVENLVRCAVRYWDDDPDSAFDSYGFRVVLSPFLSGI
jgi:formylglycine-generating enzyme required for sulfatase activity